MCSHAALIERHIIIKIYVNGFLNIMFTFSIEVDREEEEENMKKISK